MSQKAQSHNLNEIKEWIGQVDDDSLRFWRHEFKYARLVGFVEGQRQMGYVAEAEAQKLLIDLHDLFDLIAIGHRYVRYCRKPPAELEILVLATRDRT